jgi:lipid-A-disaccharide synthase
MKLAVVAGEASGDLHASKVLRELRKIDPSLTTFGIGGDLLAAEGMRILHHAKEMGIVGLFNVIRHLGMFRRVFAEMVAAIDREKPDAVLLVDYPDFNLRLARKCRELGIRVIYYISPQVWAWRRGRVREIAETVDHMIVIFPFEEEFYREHGVPVTYVGHPLIDELSMPSPAAHAAPSPAHAGEGGQITTDFPLPLAGEGGRRPGEGRPLGPHSHSLLRLALLPGSRRGEVQSLLPSMLHAVAALRKDREVDAVVIQAPTIAGQQLREIIDREGTSVRILPYDRGQSLSSADVAISSSGTATLECAILGIPVVVMYRLSRGTYFLARRLVKLPHFSLVNIVAAKQVVPELVQDSVRSDRIVEEIEKLVENRETVRADLAKVRTKLGERGASARAAAEIARLVGRT